MASAFSKQVAKCPNISLRCKVLHSFLTFCLSLIQQYHAVLIKILFQLGETYFKFWYPKYCFIFLVLILKSTVHSKM